MTHDSEPGLLPVVLLEGGEASVFAKSPWQPCTIRIHIHLTYIRITALQRLPLSTIAGFALAL